MHVAWLCMVIMSRMLSIHSYYTGACVSVCCLPIAPLEARCIQSVNYKEGGVAMGEEKQSRGFGFEASEVPELERKEFVTKVSEALALRA